MGSNLDVIYMYIFQPVLIHSPIQILSVFTGRDAGKHGEMKIVFRLVYRMLNLWSGMIPGSS